MASPTSYTAESIANGKRLFAERCATCHGTNGEGNGPATKTLSVPPGDLTSDHIYAHRDGDLFWWISNGVGDAMPAFADTVDEQGRWNLIDFIHANADAPRLRGTAGEVTGAGYPAPDFSLECPDGSTSSIRDLQGRPVLLVLGGSVNSDQLQRLSTLGSRSAVTVVVAGDISLGSNLPFCASRDASVVTALALYAGRVDADVDGIELLVDGAGQLRSIWYPKQRRPDWNEPAVFKQVVDKLKDAPPSGRTAAQHTHMH
jgi:mono/diheme cytochrome c family protein